MDKIYCAGFAVNQEGRLVALVRKARPRWQAGKLNGVGGHVEASETPLAAMIREFQEETGAPLSLDPDLLVAEVRESAGWAAP